MTVVNPAKVKAIAESRRKTDKIDARILCELLRLDALPHPVHMPGRDTRALRGLLTSLSEKQIASELGQSYHTTHEYVTAIYRKFGVNNRAALMALWLGKAV